MAPEMLRECAQWLSINLLQGAIHELFEAVLTADCKSRTLGTLCPAVVFKFLNQMLSLISLWLICGSGWLDFT